MKDNLKIFIDGACQPNPGTGGVGIFIANKEIEDIYLECSLILKILDLHS